MKGNRVSGNPLPVHPRLWSLVACRCCLPSFLASRDVLIEYYHSIGTDGGVEEQTKLRSKVKELLVGMGMSLEELAEEEQAAVPSEVAVPSREPHGEPASDPASDNDARHQGRNGKEAGEADAASASLLSPPPPPPLPPSSSELASRSVKGARAAAADDDVDMDVDDSVRGRGDGRWDHVSLWLECAYGIMDPGPQVGSFMSELMGLWLIDRRSGPPDTYQEGRR